MHKGDREKRALPREAIVRVARNIFRLEAASIFC